MENYESLKKYKSAYLTCNNWCKRDKEKNPANDGKRKMVY